MKTPSEDEEASEPRMSFSRQAPVFLGMRPPHPRWVRATLQRGSRPSPAKAGGPTLAPQADVNPGGVFFSSSYLKKKQNAPHSQQVKCRSCCHQTIILQSHDDPSAEKKKKKRGKACTAPSPSLGEATSGKAQVTEDQAHLRWGASRGEDREGGSRKFKGQNKCQPNTSAV